MQSTFQCGCSAQCVCPAAGRGLQVKRGRYMWKIAKDDVRNLERCSTVERALCTGLRRRRILTRPGIPVPLLPQGPADLVHGDDCFIVGRQKAREHALDLLQAVYELSKVITLVTLGPGALHSQSRSWEEHRHCESGGSSTSRTHSTSHAH